MERGLDAQRLDSHWRSATVQSKVESIDCSPVADPTCPHLHSHSYPDSGPDPDGPTLRS